MTLEASDASFPASYALQIVELCARWDVRADELLRGLGTSEEALSDPTVRLPATTYRKLVGRAIELTREPGLAVWMGLHMRISSHGFLGFAAMTAKTVRNAIALAERYSATRTTALGIRSYVRDGMANVILEERLDLGDTREFVVVALFVGLAGIGAALTGRPIEGVAEVTFPEPAYYRRLAAKIPGAVRFAQPMHRLVFSADVLDWPLVLADPAAAQLARDQCERELVALTEESRAAHLVRELLPLDEGYRSLEDVAKRMHVSPRTLKRQLAASGTSFTDILDQLRHGRAILLLEDRALTLDVIAERLGYSDVANFTRAFRRWTGTTPATMRKRS
jgi:AraC-like DNA-binding protein